MMQMYPEAFPQTQTCFDGPANPARVLYTDQQICELQTCRVAMGIVDIVAEHGVVLGHGMPGKVTRLSGRLWAVALTVRDASEIVGLNLSDAFGVDPQAPSAALSPHAIEVVQLLARQLTMYERAMAWFSSEVWRVVPCDLAVKPRAWMGYREPQRLDDYFRVAPSLVVTPEVGFGLCADVTSLAVDMFV
jgi:hypothetical protein